MALIESAESSNRIEGVTVEKSRLRPLVLGETRPRDRSEEEIIGYRLAFNWIHSEHRKIAITPDACLRLHALAQGETSGDVGRWKSTANDIIEILPDGRRLVRFRPLAPNRPSQSNACSSLPSPFDLPSTPSPLCPPPCPLSPPPPDPKLFITAFVLYPMSILLKAVLITEVRGESHKDNEQPPPANRQAPTTFFFLSL